MYNTQFSVVIYVYVFIYGYNYLCSNVVLLRTRTIFVKNFARLRNVIRTRLAVWSAQYVNIIILEIRHYCLVGRILVEYNINLCILFVGGIKYTVHQVYRRWYTYIQLSQ